jgi:hypothetical protein
MRRNANGGAATIHTGVSCGSVVIPITISSSIVYANTVSGGGTQIGGSANCTAMYSDIGPDTVAGTGNINADPMFVSTAQNNFHILMASSCRDVADPAATIAIDVDGDARPQGAGRDIGADEHRP